MQHTADVAVPEWNLRVSVRALALADCETFEGSGRHVDPCNLRAKVVARCMVGPDGRRIFADADAAEVLGEKSAVAIDRIFRIVLQLSAISVHSSADEQPNHQAVPAFLQSLQAVMRTLHQSATQTSALRRDLTVGRAIRAIADPHKSDDERVEASEWLARNDCRQPIAPQRSKGMGDLLRDALRREAEERAQAPSETLRDLTVRGLFLAVPAVSGDAPLGRVHQQVRTRLNDEVTQALLGPDWRHKERQAPHVGLPGHEPDASSEEGRPERPASYAPALQVWPESQIEARLEVDLLLARTPLTSLEREAILAKYRDPPEDSKVTAVRLHSTVGAVDQARHRAKEKIRAAIQ